MRRTANFSELEGKVCSDIVVHNDDCITFYIKGEESIHGRYVMHHYQDCCENVTIDDICGNLDDLIGNIILRAEERTNRTDKPKGEWDESWTWTFYTISTLRATVDLRWYGESNGYYSEGVDFEYVCNGDDEDFC